MKTCALCLLVIVFPTLAATADTINLTNGRSIQGVILKETEAGYVIRAKYTTLTLSKTEVKSVDKTKAEQAEAKLTNRLPGWEKCIDTAAAKRWVKNLQPIPATVIDKGIMKNVPYASYRSGNYEINVYGDPDNPAGVEIGIYNQLIKDQTARKNCLEYMGEVLLDQKDKAVLRTLKLAKDLKKQGDLTFEITPETDEDAYGAWWVSVYNEKALDRARATDKELKAITITKEEVKASKPTSSDDPLEKYNPADLKYSRPAGGSSGGSGSTRKDGTYVSPHTRRR
jgi:hypothetical protein